MEETKQTKDERRLSRIFPELVWLLICGQLAQSSKSLENIYYASGFWRHLLRSRRVTFLFSSVLRVLEDQTLTNENAIDEVLAENNPATERFLKLRQVHSLWCQAVLNVLQCRSMWTMPFTEVCKINALDKETEFVHHFSQSHQPQSIANPFVGNMAYLNCSSLAFGRNNIPTSNPENVPFLKVLGKYGHHVFQCILELVWNTAPGSWFDFALSHILRHMPNLKHLRVHLQVHNIVDSDASNLEISKLENLLQIETCHITTCNLSHLITNQVVTKLTNLKALTVRVTPPQFRSVDLFLGASLNHLEELDVDFENERHHEYLGRSEFRQNHSAMGKHDCLETLALPTIFKTLEAHSPLRQLQSLTLHLTCTLPKTWRQWKPYKIDIPQLTQLNLYSWNWPCIDMVLLFRNSLTNLEIWVTPLETLEEWNLLKGSEEMRLREQIQFLSCNGILDEKSNIWAELPKLEAVVLSVEVDNRVDKNRMEYWGRLSPSDEVLGFE